MDGVPRAQRRRLETSEELDEVKRRLGRIWQVIETTEIEMADTSGRITEHRERKERRGRWGLVGDTGFEPVTSAMSTQRSSHLS